MYKTNHGVHVPLFASYRIILCLLNLTTCIWKWNILISFIYYIIWIYHSKSIIGHLSVLTFPPSWFNSSFLPCSKSEGMTFLSWNPRLMTALENEYCGFFLLLLHVRQWKQLTLSWYVCFMKSSESKNLLVFHLTVRFNQKWQGTLLHSLL